MERQIPHILDVFSSSPGARRRLRAGIVSADKDDLHKNPGSDSAVGSTDDESDEQKNIAKYFDYLNEDDFSGSSQRKKKKKTTTTSRENTNKDTKVPDQKGGSVTENNEKNKVGQNNNKKEKAHRKGEQERDIRHIERHLSMKKTIRKKMMRDLQQAFVEDPKDLQQDPKGLADDKKNNIDINNLTFSKNRMSKSEHNFLDMLKEDQVKERKGLRALMDFRKPSLTAQPEPEIRPPTKEGDSKILKEPKPVNDKTQISANESKSDENIPKETKPLDSKLRDTKPINMKSTDKKFIDEDSGHDSPTHESHEPLNQKSRSRDDLDETCDSKDASSKKSSFWKRFTGKNKTKR
ncbi:uncharacterized protein LOC108674400 [Hyalella azteca]|uniref:Uncharacterized protein LOC108674400 n=1 Tax=Hyalella azteca TaxID=294128 RepID=A0A8B7NVP6_HYAAZ|nr:uncharacterized protein LOC108674400 [Hyalella azteca]